MAEACIVQWVTLYTMGIEVKGYTANIVYLNVYTSKQQALGHSD